MPNLNKVMLMGHLTREPELRKLPKGTSICQFGMAISRKLRDEFGQSREETAFVDVEAWGKQADLAQKYLTKGKAVFVEGRLKFDQWEDKQSGQKRSKLKVVLENMQFLSSNSEKPAKTDQQSLPMADDSIEAFPPSKTQGIPPSEDVPF